MKLLHLDIETTPALVYTWALFNQNISIDQVVEPTSVLCFSAKWHGEKEVMYFRSRSRTGPEFKAMLRAAHKLLSEADAVCHYNGNSFDVPRLNQEFLRLGLPPPPPIQNIDLKKVVMSKFSMTSSKLAFVGPYLGLGEKEKNEGWALWIACLKNEPNAWRKMMSYNKQDVVLLEKLYNKILPWIDAHPNMNLFGSEEDPVCPNCGSKKLERRGLRRTATYIYKRLQCMGCGRWARQRQRDKTEPTAKVV
jgi:hypothetical protein